MSKLRRLFLGCAVSSLALLPVPSRSATVCIDPGHGGETGARCANGYSEDYLALYTARLLYCDYWNHLAPWTYGIDAVFTRLTNEAPTYQYRVDVARANNAQVFLSLHANSDGAAYSMVEYDTTAIQHQRNLWTRSLVAANFVAYEVCSNYSQTRGLACHGAVLDETIVRPDSVKHLYVLRNNYVPAVLNEPFGILTAAGAAYCADADSTMLTGASERSALGLGLEYGIADFLGSGPHAPLFAPEGADQEVLLAWSESDPTRVISYVLERADNCWGPWCALAVVASGDALYTTDGIHYAYHDHTVQYARPYWYRFSSVDGQSIESGTPTGLPAPACRARRADSSQKARSCRMVRAGYRCPGSRVEGVSRATMSIARRWMIPHGAAVTTLGYAMRRVAVLLTHWLQWECNCTTGWLRSMGLARDRSLTGGVRRSRRQWRCLHLRRRSGADCGVRRILYGRGRDSGLVLVSRARSRWRCMTSWGEGWGCP